MSSLLESLGKLKVSIWQFWRLVHNANHDYPYHDYAEICNPDQGESAWVPYVVGSNQVGGHGTQKKHFVAKRTLIWDDESISFKLNSMDNVTIACKPHQTSELYTIFQMELHVNIHTIYVYLGPEACMRAYFEGVLPEEARNPE